MRERMVLDLSQLPLHGEKSTSVTWWGTWSFILIEGTGFAIVIGMYLYLASLAPRWPIDAPPPSLGPGTGVLLVLLVSAVPNYLVMRWAQRDDLRRLRIGLVVMVLFGIAPLVLRAFEFPALHIKWDTNAYGSVTWLLLGLHTTHLITDLGETIVLMVLLFTRHGENKRRYGDLEDNALYWYFVIAAWVPIYAVLYWVPRL
ncbi:MAG TPA: cytochrome c oxidase subunit 3 [Stellaceae bacterium]|nr:cytochrome c oxidase subunit 3 [Stellaceae bacterium]